MSFRVRYVGILVALLLLGDRAVGQTSQPSTAAPAQTQSAAGDSLPWSEVVAHLAKALTTDDARSTAMIEAWIPENTSVQMLGSSSTETRSRLHRECNALSIVSARAYEAQRETIATDLGADLRACDPMSETLKRQFAPRDEMEAKRANTIARQWLINVLHPSASDCVAVLVLWEPPPPITTAILIGSPPTSENKAPIFILIKAARQQDGQYQVTQIAYGDAQQALN